MADDDADIKRRFFLGEVGSAPQAIPQPTEPFDKQLPDRSSDE